MTLSKGKNQRLEASKGKTPPKSGRKSAKHPTKNRQKDKNITLSLEQKIEILKDIDDGVTTVNAVATKYGIHRSSIPNWRKKRKEYEAQVADGSMGKKKKCMAVPAAKNCIQAGRSPQRKR